MILIVHLSDAWLQIECASRGAIDYLLSEEVTTQLERKGVKRTRENLGRMKSRKKTTTVFTSSCHQLESCGV